MMASLVSIIDYDDEKLVICCRPSSRSWAICFAFIASGFAAALYASDCCLWKLIYIVLAFTVGVWYLDGWEDAIFDKSSSTLRVTSQNFLQKFICANSFNRSESVRLDDVVLVKVDNRAEKLNVVVVLVDASDISVCGSVAEISQMDCREIVDRIHSFLQLDLKHAQAGGTPVLDLPQTTPPLFGTEGVDSSPVTDDASSVTSSEESFERVSTSDLAEYDATATDAKPPPATTLPGQADEQCASVDPVTDDVQSSSSGDMPCQ